ncbi:stage III sporulation protein AD [Clostridiisalibacter paucivorans]|uniref:stage III sporulation protein AD n=1 Tax=Clostridiisalibacter paucivorans TaxID=408753 RepID=UPI00047C4DB0|nr:stage III sporulation protein AD [Clostridiisalibacter paucivorans]
MEILKIAGIGLIGTVLSVVLRQERPEIALKINLATGIIIFLMIIPKLEYVIKTLSNLAQRLDIDFMYFTTIVKVIGIAYIAEFGAQISRDAGEGTIASKIELAGKILIMIISIPILMALLDLIGKILP